MYLGNTGNKMKQMNLIQKMPKYLRNFKDKTKGHSESMQAWKTRLRSEQQKHKYNHMG